MRSKLIFFHINNSVHAIQISNQLTLLKIRFIEIIAKKLDTYIYVYGQFQIDNRNNGIPKINQNINEKKIHTLQYRLLGFFPRFVPEREREREKQHY